MADPTESSWETDYESYIHHSCPDSEIRVPRIEQIPIDFDDCFCVDFSEAYGRPFFRTFCAGLPRGRPTAVQPACAARYGAGKDDKGRLYYKDLATGSTSRDLPGAKNQKKDFKVGMCIELRAENEWYHLCAGEIVLFCGQKILVSIPDFSREVVVGAEEIVPVSKGKLVKLIPSRVGDFGSLKHGIMVRALRDEKANEIVYEVDDSLFTGAYIVPPIYLKSPRFDGLDAAMAAKCSWPETAEHLVILAMPDLSKEEFYVHFPFKFPMAESKLQVNQVAKWPLMIYLHGSGGGTFMSFAKRNEHRNEGCRYAAEHFIIVSPSCKWGWKNPPLPWVLTLVRELCKLPYVDSSRVYLTGVSMGGMGCWELGMQDPGLFAAVAPIAAYHKSHLRSEIAEALKSTPIFAVHSHKDATCPLSKEKFLYEELQRVRALLRVDLCNHSHTDMHKPHMEDPTIFEWMLSHPYTPKVPVATQSGGVPHICASETSSLNCPSPSFIKLLRFLPDVR